MAFSQNPFSVATFGESYEQASLTVTLTGVQGTGGISGSGFDVRSIVTVTQTGVQATSAIGTLTIVSKAVVAPTGVQATGTANTVTATGGTGVTFTLSSVAGTGAIGTLTVVAKAVVVPTGVEGTVITDDPLVTGDEIVVDAEADIALTGVGGTGSTGSPTIISQAVVVPTGVEGDIITDSILVDGDEVVIDAEADVDLSGKGVSGTTALNGSVTLVCKAVVLPTGVQGTFTVGNEIINTVQFDYESIKDNYSKARTVYIGSASSNTNTSYVNSASRTVYVGPASSNTNTSYVRAA